MTNYLSVEELVIDDSFINYCLQKNEIDTFYWRQYINDFPLERIKIEEAKQLVLGLHVMLKHEHVNRSATDKHLPEKNSQFLKKISVKNIFWEAADIAKKENIQELLQTLQFACHFKNTKEKKEINYSNEKRRNGYEPFLRLQTPAGLKKTCVFITI